MIIKHCFTYIKEKTRLVLKFLATLHKMFNYMQIFCHQKFIYFSNKEVVTFYDRVRFPLYEYVWGKFGPAFSVKSSRFGKNNKDL